MAHHSDEILHHPALSHSGHESSLYLVSPCCICSLLVTWYHLSYQIDCNGIAVCVFKEPLFYCYYSSILLLLLNSYSA